MFGRGANLEMMSCTNAPIVSGVMLNADLLTLMPQSSLPDHLLLKARVEGLFESQCASCHGAAGGGDGVMAAQLEPGPTDFTSKERALNRSLLGLYDAISNGIDDTAMRAYTQLTKEQRWSLAFHVGGLAFQSDSEVTGEALGVTLSQMVNHTPAQLAAEHPDMTQKGMTEYFNLLKYNKKINPIDSVICIIKGVFHGIPRGLEGNNQQYNKWLNGAVMVSRVPN